MQLEVLCRRPAVPPRASPLLFVHGFWHGAWCWAEHFLPYFAERGYEAHALSLRGHGESPGRARLRWTGLRDFVADVANVAAGMDRPPILIGHSMGGFLVQKYLETHHAPGAVLLASLPPSGALGVGLRLARRYPRRFAQSYATLSTQPLIATPVLARECLFSLRLPEADLERYHARLQDESFRVFVELLVKGVRTAAVETPVLVLGASEDAAVSAREVEATAAAFQTRAEFVPDIAHDMMLEPNWRSAAERIDRWLTELHAASP